MKCMYLYKLVMNSTQKKEISSQKYILKDNM